MAEAVINFVIARVESLISMNLGEAHGLLADLEELVPLLSAILVTDEKTQSTHMEKQDWLRLLEIVASIARGALDESQNSRQEVYWFTLYSVFNFDASIHEGDRLKLIRALISIIDRLKAEITSPLVAPFSPLNLIRCLLKCSKFPEGYEMNKYEVVFLWIANDFISSEADKELEDVGDAIFTDLLRCGFFQDPILDTYGTLSACKMHELVHVLLSFQVEGDLRIIEVEKKKAEEIKRIRYLSLINKSRRRDRLPSLFTSLFFRKLNFKPIDVSCLRALDLSGLLIENIPPSVCDLKHLRYLNLSKNYITSLPESIHGLGNLQVLNLSENEGFTTLPLCTRDLNCLRHINLSQCSVSSLPESILGLTNLQTLDWSRNYSVTTLPQFSIGNLQSLSLFNLSECSLIATLPESLGHLTNLQWLILRGCSSLVQLPGIMWKMTSLRHLDIHGCSKLTKMPIGIGKLTQLQTLNLFPVGRPDRDGECGGIQELQGLDQLHGELEIQGLEFVTANHAREAHLQRKFHLKKLKLTWGFVDSLQEIDCEDTLEGLQLPPNIQQLIINAYPLAKCFPQEVLANLSRLQSLQISNCKELVSLPEGLRNIISLKELRIECCHRLKCLPVIGIRNPKGSLVSLTIDSCDSLTSVTNGLLYLRSLKTLSLKHCPQLELETEDFQYLISLLYLQIEWLPKLKALPEGIEHLSMLQQLEIEYCWNLRNLSEGLQCLTSLETLKIHYCPELQLTRGDFQHLGSLKKLTIGFLPKLSALPKEIQHLTRLRHLEILRCENLRMLPDSFKLLISLESLKIRDCHQDLHKRCDKEKGEDWHLISHILYNDIDKPPKESSTLSKG